ncbi:MAG: hemerythrin domain-containing protein [Ignavibacteriaceae bacterium]
MKRHPALIPLSQDHHQALLLAMILKKNAPKINNLPTDLLGKMNYAKKMYDDELEQHFRDEEQFVFPFLINKDPELDELLNEIIEEHIILKEKIFSLYDSPKLSDQLNEIGVVLENHVRKEERILFEKAQQILSDEELKLIENKFDESRPQNKSCIIKSNNKQL